MGSKPQFEHEQGPEARGVLAFAVDMFGNQLFDRLGPEQAATQTNRIEQHLLAARSSAHRGTSG